jgi:RHS repeat-associated protein
MEDIQQLQVLFATGAGSYTAGPITQRPEDPFSGFNGTVLYAAGELTGDTFADLAILGGQVPVGQSQLLAILPSNGDGTFGAPRDIPNTVANSNAISLTIGNVNGDARNEVLLGRNGAVSVYAADAAGQYALSATTAIAVNAFLLTLPDVDGDGDADFVASSGGNISTRLNDGQGTGTEVSPATRTFTYDAQFNQLTSVTDELGHQTLYEIDPTTGNLLSETRVIGAVGGADDLVTRYTYTPLGLVDTMTDPLGVVTDNNYNSFGQLTQVIYALGTPDEAIRSYEYNAAGNRTAEIDENGNRTTHVFDTLNRLESTTTPDPDGGGPLQATVTTYGYEDPRGNLTSVTVASGGVTIRTTMWEYNDDMNRLTKVIEADPDGPAGPLLAPVTTYVYDDEARTKVVTDPLLHATQYFYDTRNRVERMIDAKGGVTRYEYDEANNRTAITDPEQNRTVFGYDARNRLVTETDPLGRTTTFVYDPLNNRTSMTDRNGRVTNFVYDDVYRLQTETWAATGGPANTIQFAYDKVGRLTSVQDNFSSLAHTYDARGRLTAADNNGTPGVPRVVLTYAYDDVGNVLSLADTISGAAGGLNNYLYDARNRLVRLTQAGAGVSAKRVDFAYNPINQHDVLSRFADLAGTQLVTRSTYAYDGQNRLTGLVHNNGTVDVASYRLTYDAASRIRQIVDVDGTRTYTHDDTNQLAGANYTSAAQTDEAFAYDDNGNRTGAGIVTGPANRLLSDGTFNYQYDNEGNLILRTEIATGRVREFQWDHRNRLVRVTDRDTAAGPATQVVRYTYDAMDRRIAKAVDTTPQDSVDALFTHFVYDRDDVLLEFRDADGAGAAAPILSMRYLHGPRVDEVLAQEDFLQADPSARVLWLLPDHLGSTRDLVDNTGTVRNHIVYDAFGGIVSQSDPAFGTRYLFTGREFDSETGLYYYRARYYDPATGRFLSEDPLRFDAGTANFYAYVGNDPIGKTDPTGKFTRSTKVTFVAENLLDGSATVVVESLLSGFNLLPNNNLLLLFYYWFPGEQNTFFFPPGTKLDLPNVGDELTLERGLSSPDGSPDPNAVLTLKGVVEVATSIYPSVSSEFPPGYSASAEWLVLAGLGLLAGGRGWHSRRKRRRQRQAAASPATPTPRTPLEAVDDVFVELGDDH